MAEGLKGWHQMSNGLTGKVVAGNECKTCDLYEQLSGDYPHLCRAGGYSSAQSLADDKWPDDECSEYREKSSSSSSTRSGDSLASKAGNAIKDAAMRDVKTGLRNLGKMI